MPTGADAVLFVDHEVLRQHVQDFRPLGRTTALPLRGPAESSL